VTSKQKTGLSSYCSLPYPFGCADGMTTGRSRLILRSCLNHQLFVQQVWTINGLPVAENSHDQFCERASEPSFTANQDYSTFVQRKEFS
jgi:hypothetical protein